MLNRGKFFAIIGFFLRKEIKSFKWAGIWGDRLVNPVHPNIDLHEVSMCLSKSMITLGTNTLL